MSGQNKNTGMYAPKIRGTGNNLSIIPPGVYIDEDDIDAFLDNVKVAKATIAQIKSLIEEMF